MHTFNLLLIFNVMIKNKFLISVLTSTVVTTTVCSGETWEKVEYTGDSVKDVLVTVKDSASDGATEVKGYKDIGVVGLRRTEQIVRNSTLIMESGYAQYLTADALNDGIVTGERTLTMTGGSADFVAAGALVISNNKPTAGYYQSPGNPNNPCPYQSDKKVTLNICGNAVVNSKLYGGAVISDTAFMNTLKTGDLGVGGDVYIKVYGNAQVKGEIRGGGGTHACVEGKVTINLYDNAIVTENIYGGARGGLNGVGAYVRNGTNITVDGNAQIQKNIYGGSSYSATSAYSYADTNITVSGGTINGNVYGGGDRDIIQGATNVVISGGVIKKSVYGGGSGSTITNGTNVTLSGGSISGTVYGTGENDTVKGDVTLSIQGGDWADTDIVALADGARLEGGKAYLYVGSDKAAYNGGVKSFEGFDHLVVHKNSSFDMSGTNVFGISNQTITLSTANLQKAAVTGGYAEVGSEGVSLTLLANGRLRSGRYMVASVDSLSRERAGSNGVPNGWTADNVTVNGIATFNDLTWDGTTLYLTYEAPHADAAVSANWGVFKSSHAFTSCLWNNRSNAVVLDAQAPVTIPNDGKSPVIVAAPAATMAGNLAWGSVYSQSGRISGIGADYSLYGAAIGAERRFGSTGSNFGVAFGYDWGKVTPFATTGVDQETWHAALYGRIGAWKACKGIVSVDWSAAYGDTTSRHNAIAGDWSQESWQFDVRANYAREISEKATACVFAGIQYYTHDDAKVDGLHISSQQNLRLMLGGSLSYAATARLNVYGQTSVYFDAMRHNPHVDDSGMRLEGTNPGRIGGVFSLGADYTITDQWSLRGGYSFDVAEDNTEHNVNAGVHYSF